MTVLLLTLAILLVAIVNLWIIRRTKAMRKRQPYVAPTPLPDFVNAPPKLKMVF